MYSASNDDDDDVGNQKEKERKYLFNLVL